MTRSRRPAEARRAPARRGPARFGLLAGLIAALAGCEQEGGLRKSVALETPAPAPPLVVALGNLRGGRQPSRAQVELAVFLFGLEPEPALGLVKPAALATRGAELLICDTALNAVLRWERRAGTLSDVRLAEAPAAPTALATAPDGGLLVVDVAAASVRRYDAGGRPAASYRLAGQPFRPAAALSVDRAVWVTNVAADRLEVFDADSGEHLRSIGSRGNRPGQFRIPLGLARTPEGQVCVVDMLNNRVQVLDEAGNWLRTIGQPGDLVGSFGRPKDVAVAPDGTVFVSDAASQRVHAFLPDGRPLLAFGQSDPHPLSVPAGVAVATEPPITPAALPPGFRPACYVLVAEQVSAPGVRVYAWGGSGPAAAALPLPSARALDAVGRPTPRAGDDPHWNPDRCTDCHRRQAGRLLPIGLEAAGALCARCHAGHAAASWAHPVDGPAAGAARRIPTGWPLLAGRLVCLTCHDVRRHCRPDVQPPGPNAALLRDYDPQRRRAFCAACHVETVGWVASPHGQLDERGRVNRQSCLFCHRRVPEIPADGRRRFRPQLREVSGSCLNCHGRHWDYAPGGHPGRLVPASFLRQMRAAELGRQPGASAQRQRGPVAGADWRPARFPLAAGRVACYSCHNPHQRGLFPAGSELDTRARWPVEAARRLRADRPELCLHCHDK